LGALGKEIPGETMTTIKEGDIGKIKNCHTWAEAWIGKSGTLVKVVGIEGRNVRLKALVARDLPSGSGTFIVNSQNGFEKL
jgi:hypothetical protein